MTKAQEKPGSSIEGPETSAGVDDGMFETALRQALTSAEITDAVRSVRFDPDEIALAVRAREAEVWAAVATEANALADIEDSQQAASNRLEKFLRSRSRWIFRGFGLIALLSMAELFSSDNERTLAQAMLFGSLALLVWLVGTGWRRLTEFRLRRELKPQLLATQAAQARKALAAALETKGVLPEIRKEINEGLRRSSARALVYVSTSGLRETSDHQLEVPTPVGQRLAALLEHRGGGTIGITGPRGSGKTTLVRSVCGRNVFAVTGAGPRLSVVVPAPVQYDARDFLLYLFATLCRIVIGTDADRLALSSASWASVMRSQDIPDLIRRIAGRLRRQPGADGRSDPGADDTRCSMHQLRKEAAALLTEIEWQQTYTSGWSGNVQLPHLGQFERNFSRSLVRHQRTYPQLADDLRTFLTHAAATGQVVIGIDELDKIESAETAQDFLNDLKILFGLKRCFFLISLSENALCDFQRRALGFRNVFDSSFDDILRVPHFTAEESIRLLERRIIGLPVLFALLCHCLSGGLPRDLIRVARALVELDVAQGSDLDSAARALVAEELSASAEATVLNARIDANGAVGTASLRWLRQLTTGVNGSLLEHCRLLLSDRIQSAGEPTIEKANTALGVLALTYYCATVVEVFSTQSGDDSPGLVGSQSDAISVADELVHARQLLAVHPALAWDAVSAFRRRHELELLLDFGDHAEVSGSLSMPGDTSHNGSAPARPNASIEV